MKKGIKILFCFFSMLLLVIGINLSKGYELPHFNGEITYQDQCNLIIEETAYNEDITLPYNLKYNGNHKYILTSKIMYNPKETDSPYAFISFNHMYFKAFINDVEIYSYTSSDTSNISKSPGNIYSMIPLPMDCYGKELRLEIYPTLGDSLEYKLGKIYLGDYPTFINNQFKSDLAHNILTICTLFTGIVLIIVSYIILKKNSSRDAWFIGLFAVVFGIYNLSENLFNLYMISNTYIIYLINFILFACIPIPLIYFFKTKVEDKYRRYYDIIGGLLFINVIAQTIVHFMKLRDLRENLIFTHIILIVSFILIIYTVIKTSKDYYVGKKYLLLSVIPIFIGMIIDGIILYFTSIQNSSNTYFMQIGVSCFLVLQAIFVLQDIVKTYRENIKGEFYKSLAYKDGLTGLYNRRAYNVEIDKINNKQIEYNRLTCICVDINNLKQINDEQGHEAGDRAIILTANYLNSFFGEYGKVFRLGGDEFTALLYNLTEEELLYRIKEMYKDLRGENEKSDIKVCFALGYEDYSDSYTNGIEECIRKADKKMYNEKIKSKICNREE